MLRLGVFSAAVGAVLLFGAPANAGSLKDDYRPTTNWSGLYVGGHAGYAWGDWDGTLTTTALPLNFSDPHRKLSDEGWLGGLQAGYNVQHQGIVFGIEADISWSDVDATGTFDTDQGGPAVWSKKHDLSLDYFGTVRARLGLPTGHFLPYVTGGLAWGKTNADLAVAYIPPPPQAGGTSYASGDETHVGWTVGGGVEVALGSNWSFKAEYLHIDLGKEDYFFKGTVFNGAPFETDSFPADLTVDTVRVGLNYRFGERDAPVPLK